MTAYPWHIKQWQQLLSAYEQKKLSHAFIFHGLAGLGKFEFAMQFANFLLCVDSNKNAANACCQTCKSCRLFQGNNHPDFQLVTVEEEASVIKLEQIKEIVAKNNYTSQYQGYRVVLISPAEKMNTATANALLKTLEEPQSEFTVFILVTESIMRLLATLRSRCQHLLFNPPTLGETKEWLSKKNCVYLETDFDFAYQYSQGSPRMISELLDDTGNTITLLKKTYELFLHVAQTGKLEIREARASMEKLPILSVLNCLQLALVQGIKAEMKLNKVKLYQLLDEVALQKNALLKGIALNNTLIIEKCLIQLVAALRTK